MLAAGHESAPFLFFVGEFLSHALDDAHVNESREYSTRLIPFMCTTSTQYFILSDITIR